MPGRFPRFLSIACLAAVVAACGDLPRPFKRTYATPPNPLVEEGVQGGVWVDEVEGPPVPMARLLADSVARELGKLEVPAFTGKRRPTHYVLKGEAVRNVSPEVPYVVQVHWTLLDRSGNRVGIHSQGVTATNWEWDYGSPKVVREVGEASATAIAALVQADDPTLKPVRTATATGLWVKPIDGAPGDGDVALTRAIRIALAGAGTDVVSEKTKARYVLDGSVRLSPPRGAGQRVEIVWVVRTPAGNEIGRAAQANTVPVGTFDRRWGNLAALVAAAAVGGIRDIVDAASDAADSGGTHPRILKTNLPFGPAGVDLPLPEPPPDPRLPRLPGRAPPPPG